MIVAGLSKLKRLNLALNNSLFIGCVEVSLDFASFSRRHTLHHDGKVYRVKGREVGLNVGGGGGVGARFWYGSRKCEGRGGV